MNNHNDKFQEKELISNFELAGLVVVFLIVLIVLFPKNTLKNYILQERSNYNLARDYLQSLIKAYPKKNNDFVKYLIEFDLKLYDIKSAYKVISQYKNDFKNDVEFKILHYKVVKQLYFSTKNNRYKKEAKSVLMSLLKEKPEFVLREAKAFDFLKLQFLALKRLKRFNETFLNLALYFKDYELANRIIDKLCERERSLNYLIKNAQIKEMLKKFKLASRIYLIAYKKSGKIEFFKRAFNVLVWNKKYKEAYKLAKKYENFFLFRGNIDILKMFLNFYLATHHLKAAKNLSLKIKQRFHI